MWFETHTHLSDSKFDADRPETIQRAIEAGVTRLVEIADGPEEWENARRLAETHSNNVWWAAGVHPYFSDATWATIEPTLRSFCSHPSFIAIGEIGLDYAKCPIPREAQKDTFRRAIRLSLELQKPMIIHCRDAYFDLIAILRDELQNGPSSTASPGVIHCFSGNKEDVVWLLRLGFYIGVDGPITYPSATSLRDALSGCPLDRLVLETDSPYLPPQTHRGQRNEPSYLPTVGIALAKLVGVSPEKCAEQTTANAYALYRRKQVV